MKYRSTLATAGGSLAAVSAAAMMGLAVPSPVSAQQAARQAGELEEIVVSARRREESAQDVPISISAFTAEELALRNIEMGRDLSIMVPNLVMGAGSLGQEQSDLRIRGVPGVGIYLDGVWQGSRGVLQANLVEMERVEVLRGPQGTLFGRNTNGGAIQYVTRPPSDQYSGSVELASGSFDRRDVKATINLPLTDNLYTKWTAARFEHDGFLNSVSPYDPPGTAYDDRNDTFVRGDLLWDKSDTFNARLTLFNAEQRSTEGRQVRFSNQVGAEWFTNNHIKAINWLMSQPGAQFPAPQFDPVNYEAGYSGGVVGEWETRARQPEGSLMNDSNDVTVRLNWTINDNMSFESITAVRREEAHQLSLQDGADFVACCRDDRYYDDELTSQEFHLTGSAMGGRLNYLGGLYYSDATNKIRLYRWWMTNWYLPDADGDGKPELNTALRQQVRDYGTSIGDAGLAGYSPLPFWVNNNLEWNQTDEEERAIFGEVSYDISDRMELTVGVRWSWRDVIENTYLPGPNDAAALFLTSSINSPTEYGGIGPGNMFGGVVEPPAVPGINEVHLSGDFTPKVSLTYGATDDVMVYGTYAEGFSEGGIEYVPELDRLFTLVPEVVSSYEFGFKSDLLNETLRLNGSYFFGDWEGLRVTRHPPDPDNPGQELPTPYTTSDGSAEVEGYELEVVWFATDDFSLNFNYGHLETRYTDIGDPDFDQTLAFGARFAFAPENSYSIGAQYDMILANQAGVTLRADYGWQDEYERDPSIARHRLSPEPAYGLLNMRAVYTAPSGMWSAALWGTNLTDEHYVDGGFVSAGLGFSLDTVGPPRQYGVTLNVNF